MEGKSENQAGGENYSDDKSGNTLSNVVLRHLNLPVELLKLFKELKYTVTRFETITKDELVSDLQKSGWSCDWDALYQRITAWRKLKGLDLITFTKVEVIEEWVCSEDQDVDSSEQPEECLLSEQTLGEVLESSSEENNECNLSKVKQNTDLTYADASVADQSTGQSSVLLDVNEVSQQSQVTNDPSTSTHSNIPKAFFGPRELESLLRSSLTGLALLARSLKGPFSERSQKELAGIISEYHLSLKIQITEEILECYATSINLLFRLEKKELYYIPRRGNKRNPGGKIYNKIVNTKQKRAKREKLEKEIEAKRQKPNNDGSTEPDIEGDAALNWLVLNTHPWGTTVDKWIASFHRRRPELQNPLLYDKLLGCYHHYKDPYGYQLIDVDYRMLYKTGNDASNKWAHILAATTSRLCQQYKDEVSNSLVSLLQKGGASKDLQICAVIILLNNVLPPSKVKKDFKPTVLFAQEDTVIFAESEEDVQNKVDEINLQYAEWGFPPVARLVFVGSSAATLTGKYYVFYKDLVYTLDSVARAVDVLVKTTLVFGAEFSRITRLVWNFICSYLYEIPGLANYSLVLKLITGLDEQNQVGHVQLHD